MALENSRSSVAPIDFDIYNSFEETNGVISVAVENCELCASSRNPFHCQRCVRLGDFSKSGDTQMFRDKLYSLRLLKQRRTEILADYQSVISKQTALTQKNVNIDVAKQRIALLTKAVSEALTKHRKEETALAASQEFNKRIFVRLKQLSERRRRVRERLDKLRLNIDNRRGELAVMEDQLCSLRQTHIQQLVNHIFPITQIQSRSETDNGGYVSELAEARHTAYIKGRWVYTDNGAEHRYRIIHPTLPGNGDYTLYLNWLHEGKVVSPGMHPVSDDDEPAYTIAAALLYTAQLANLFSYFLDINLPMKVCYGEFSKENLTVARFSRFVYRLNRNILHLCFSQKVSTELINPVHTMHNMLVLLNTPALGRCVPFAAHCDMIQSLEAHKAAGLDDNSDDDTGDHQEEPPPGYDQEWERVPISIPDIVESHMSSHPVESSYSGTATGGASRLGDVESNTASVIGGIAASVTSLWRATWKS